MTAPKSDFVIHILPANPDRSTASKPSGSVVNAVMTPRGVDPRGRTGLVVGVRWLLGSVAYQLGGQPLFDAVGALAQTPVGELLERVLPE
jgi:hypothetical protein